MISDFPGLLHALVLDGHGGAKPVTAADVATGRMPDGLYWLHFDYTTEAAENWLREHSGLSDVAVEALLAAETRPRVTTVDDGLLISLRGVNLNPGADPEDMVAIRLWIDGTRLISTLRRDLLAVGDVIQKLDRSAGPTDCGSLLAELCDSTAMRMEAVVDEAEDQVAALENRLLEDTTESLREDLSILRRQVIALRRYLAPQREALNRLAAERVSWVTELHRMMYRETADQLIRYIEDLDVVRERAGFIIEELHSHLSERLNRRLYVLSVAAAVFLPLTFLTGLLGINVGGIPGRDSPWAFYTVVGVVAVILVVQVWLLRRRRWM